MQITDFFPSTVDRNSISVYIGRVIKLDDNFRDNGILYVDLVDPNGTDLEKGAKTSDKASASYAVRTLYKCWENPPEIKSKAQFEGSMNFTSSGDFHLRNYCFDMYTLTWILQVSSILNILFPIMPNVPPPMISIDTTPFPGQAVSVNVSTAAKEVVNESIQSVLKDIKGNSASSIQEIPDVEEYIIKYDENNNQRTRSLRSTSSSSDSPISDNDPVYKVINSIVRPIESLFDFAVNPYYDFIECISILLEIYEKRLNEIGEITFPITQFSEISADGTATVPSPLDNLAIQNSIRTKIDKFKDGIHSKVDGFKNDVEHEVIRKVYEPVASLYSMVDTKIQDIVTPIKNKVVELIGNFVKDPISELTGLIAMAIQPLVSSLPTIVQLIVKLAIKKLLQLLLGTPIKLILEVVVDPIIELINKATEKIEEFVGQIISTTINTLINPIIEVMQKSLAALQPDFSMSGEDGLIKKLKNIRDNDDTPFPKIFIENEPVKPYKDFDEINWSNPSELKAMILSLLEDLKKEKDSETRSSSNRNSIQENPPESIEIQENKEEIWKLTDDQIQGADQEAKVEVFIKDNEGKVHRKSPNDDKDLMEGTLMEGLKPVGELFYKKFSTKDEFLPYFEERHNPVPVDAVIGNDTPVTIFTNLKPQVWLTNGVAYVEVEDKGEKVRYVCYYNKGGQTIGIKKVKCLVNGIVVERELQDNLAYYSTTIPHIKKNESDSPVGEDLVPVIENGFLKQVKIPKTVDTVTGDRQIGDILYNENVNTGAEKTFKELTDEYYRVKVDNILSVSSLADDIKKVLNDNSGSVLDRFKQTDLYKSLFGNSDYTFYYYRITKVTEDERDTDVEKEVKEKVTSLSPFSDSMINCSPSNITSSTTSLTITITNNPLTITTTTLSEPTGMKLEIKFEVEDNKLTKNTEFSMRTLIQVADNIVDWPTEDNAILTCCKKDLDTSTDYYCWMLSYLQSKNVNTSSLQDQSVVHDKMADMFVHTVQAIGQDGDFSADALFKAEVGKVTSEFDKITESVSGIDSIISSTLERVSELKEIGSFIDKIAEIGDKIKKVASTAGPAVEATAKAASAVAIQSCSMSQSATGKDFSFTSGNNYDLSTTTTSKAQLPYCRELGREEFLEPNCKVLVLAVGAGKQNLYVVDILT